jgi:Right handed beta helix region
MIRSLVLAVLLSLTFSAAAQWDAVSFELDPIERIEGTDIAHSFGTLRNNGTGDLHDVLVSVQLLPEGADIYVGGESNGFATCANSGTPYQVYCTVPLLRAGQTGRLQIYVGPIRETRVKLSGNAQWRTPEASLYTPSTRQISWFARDFVVTNTGDLGPGSFRDAIERANAECARDNVACRIAFNIDAPVPERGWYTIIPNTPLPAITAPDIDIDGSTQTRFGGDTNPNGPELELSGAGVWYGNGLEIRGEGVMALRHLSIDGFPANGVKIARKSFTVSIVHDNRIARNGSRGLAFDAPSAFYDVTHNVIRGNQRSGIYVLGGTNMEMVGNTVEANGAAGVFFGPTVDSIVLRHNAISRNVTGIAVAREAVRYAFLENTIAHNATLAIDRGIDGFDGYALDETDVHAARIPPPLILSATYDAVSNTTTISGTYHPRVVIGGSWSMTFYRSATRNGQGEVLIGSAATEDGAFAHRVSGDLRGQFITATGFHESYRGAEGNWYWTSEFSEPVEVR